MSDSDSEPQKVRLIKKGHKTKAHSKLQHKSKDDTQTIRQNGPVKRKPLRASLQTQLRESKKSKKREKVSMEELEPDSDSETETYTKLKNVKKGHLSRKESTVTKHKRVGSSDDESDGSDSAPEELSSGLSKMKQKRQKIDIAARVASEEPEDGSEEEEEGGEESEESGEELGEAEEEGSGMSEGEERDEDDLSNSAGGDSTVTSRLNDKSAESIDQSYASLRKELLNMPFDELQQLKEKIGTKLYNQVLFGQEAHSKKRKFKRENKNRPMEVSSKIKTSRQRQIIPVRKKLVRDPRFDDLSGEYKEDIFKSTYSFLSDVKQNEKKKLLKRLEKEKDEERKGKMEYLVRRMTAQEKAEKNKEQQQERDRLRKKNERSLVSDGKKPYYLKKSDKKTLELAEKYRELKRSGKVEKYMSKKRKKNAQKERRNLPTQ